MYKIGNCSWLNASSWCVYMYVGVAINTAGNLMPGIMLNQRSYTEEVWESAEGFLCIV